MALLCPTTAVAKRKQIVKDLKRPDQFVDFWTRASHIVFEVLVPRRKPAVAAAVALAVVLIGAAILNYWDESRRLTSSRALALVQEIANAELLATPDGAKPESPDETKADVPRFKTAPERQTAVLNALDDFFAKHGGSSLKAEALIMKGAALLGAGRFDDAIATYQSALSEKLDTRLRFLAHEGLGYAYEGKKDLDKALAAFAQIADDAKNFQGFYQDAALYHKARLTELKGDKSGAVVLYKQLLEKGSGKSKGASASASASASTSTSTSMKSRSPVVWRCSRRNDRRPLGGVIGSAGRAGGVGGSPIRLRQRDCPREDGGDAGGARRHRAGALAGRAARAQTIRAPTRGVCVGCHRGRPSGDRVPRW